MDLALGSIDLRVPIGALVALFVVSLALRLYLSWAARADQVRSRAVLARLHATAGDREGSADDRPEHDG